jgi:hypothetical protein
MYSEDLNHDAPLARVQLGDLITLPNGRAVTARARVTLEFPIHEMAGFIICNELEVLLATPSTTRGPVSVYTPVDHMPYPKEHLREVAAGATRYWAPHLPGLTGAMGELLFRVFEVRGSVDPVVVVYRGEELVVFIKASYAFGEDLKVSYMPRSNDNDLDVTRHAAVVDDPSLVPDPLTSTPRRSLYDQMVG